jgi:hypothetical protein
VALAQAGAPQQRLARAHRHERVRAERQLGGHRRRGLLERDAVLVDGQAIELRATQARERFEPVHRAHVVERFGIQLDARV